LNSIILKKTNAVAVDGIQRECTNRVATGHCEEREARRGNLYKTRNAPFYIKIASSDALRVLLAMTRRVYEQCGLYTPAYKKTVEFFSKMV
jgi:hypothetical protein